MKPEERRRIMGYWVPASLFLLLGLYLFSYFEISVERAILFPSTLFASFLNTSADTGTMQAIQSIGIDFSQFVIPFIPIIISLSILSSYGALYGEDKRLGLSVGLVSVISLFLFNFSMSAILLTIGIMAACMLATGLGFTHFAELKKWKGYRTGTYTVGRIILIINIFLVVAVFVNASSNIETYTDSYKDRMRETIADFGSGLFAGNIPIGGEMSDQDIIDTLITIDPTFKQLYDSLPESEKELLIEQYRGDIEGQIERASKQIEPQIDNLLESPKISPLLEASVIMSPFYIFGVLETLKSLLFTPIAGLVTSIMLSRKKS